MAANVVIAGATYQAVPAVNLPKSGGGTARFTDVSDTTAAAADVAQGKVFYDASGEKKTGTNQGGGGGGMNVQAYIGRVAVQRNGYTETAVKLTVAVTGTYRVSWTAWRSSSSGTMGTNLHVNNTAGTNQTTFTNTYGQQITLTGQQYSAGDVLTLYATAGSTTRTINVANLIIEQTA